MCLFINNQVIGGKRKDVTKLFDIFLFEMKSAEIFSLFRQTSFIALFAQLIQDKSWCQNWFSRSAIIVYIPKAPSTISYFFRFFT